MSPRRTAPHRHLRVTSIDPGTLKSRPLADFALVNGEVWATFHDEVYREELTRSGIATAKGRFWPRDGEAFMRELWVTYSRSSFRYVEAAPAPLPRKPRAQRGTQPPASDLDRQASTAGKAKPAARARTRTRS